MSDEAKNAYESLIYKLRAWLQEEENIKFVTGEEKTALITKLDDGEEWLYGEGAHQTHTKYQERSYALTSELTKFENRKSEWKSR
jgi:uncharacterized protein (DUF2164 family)